MAPVLVVEDDPFLRIVQLVLDPDASAERFAAFADFFAHDEPDFAGWRDRLRQRVGQLFPAQVRLVATQDELAANLADARALIVEGLAVGAEEIAAAPHLKVIQKFGTDLRRIDTEACATKGIVVLGIRRRANIACAELAITLMLMLARRVNELHGRIAQDSLASFGHPYKPYDRRHTPNSNWGRVPGLETLYGKTLGIIGLGEIGREVALRAAAFGMRILYTQRRQAAAAVEREFQASYRPFEQLLAESDWILPLVPGGPQTRGLIGQAAFAHAKKSARLVNISRADVVDRAALIEALRAGRIAGFALDPLYEAPGREDDELLAFHNVILTPHIAAQPRFNALNDLADMIENIARALAA